jgi:hypothetical protein
MNYIHSFGPASEEILVRYIGLERRRRGRELKN